MFILSSTLLFLSFSLLILNPSVFPLSLGQKVPSKLVLPNRVLSFQIRQFFPDLDRTGKLAFSLFQLLPVDLILVLLSFLDHRALCRLACMNHEWATWTQNGKVWTELYRKHFGITTKLPPDRKTAFKSEWREKFPAAASRDVFTAKGLPAKGIHLIPMRWSMRWSYCTCKTLSSFIS